MQHVSEFIPADRNLVMVNDTADVAEVLQILEKKKLTSLPVLVNGKFSGFVDVLDLLTVLVRVATEEHESHVTPPSKTIHTDDVSMILERSNQFKLHSIREQKVKNASHRDYCVSVALTDPISAAVRHFETGGLHRVGVVDARGELVNVLTQSDVVAWAAQDIEHRVRDGNTLAETIMKVPYAVLESEYAIDAFCELEAKHFSGAPMVNDEGLLVGSLSSSDLKQLNASSFLHLLDPLSKWNKSNRLLFVTKSTSLDAIVKRMSEWRAHRVFVVEAADNMKLVGVISLQDIIKKLEF